VRLKPRIEERDGRSAPIRARVRARPRPRHGYAFHSSRAAFERDRKRDADLAARGFRVVRVTWRQIVDRPEAVIARIAVVLER
jgi:hypothetical protein